MWVAAPTLRRYFGLGLLALILCRQLGSTAAAQTRSGRTSPAVPREIWAVEVRPRVLDKLGAHTAARLRRAGVNALLADTSLLNDAQLARMRSLAERERFLMIVIPRSASDGAS